ncbi:MAG: DUF2283 domain-containing protein [Dehalococcoidia bacterium]|nr:DUF2283 domain-containing protein [Dehalococcoidia bacterium]
MRLKVYYDKDTDILSLWNGRPASEADDVAEHLVADFDDDGEVVGFTLEHASELLGTIPSVPSTSAEYLATSGKTVLEKLKEAFFDLYEEKVADHTFKFRPRGAAIYVRKTNNGYNTARIIPTSLRNFPYGNNLELFVKSRRVPKDESTSHPDYLIGPDHIDELIDILKGKSSLRSNELG